MRESTAMAKRSGGLAAIHPPAAAPHFYPGRSDRLTPGLYLVATPIGNLRDITLRALDVLHGVDLVACEDTRVTAKLFNAYQIATPKQSYHDHNAERLRPKLIAKLQAGGRVALVSDAGTPLISDPGYRLVKAAYQANIAVTALPGASALLPALQLSGLPNDRFSFVGFLPRGMGAMATALRELAEVPGSVIVYEAGPRLADTLSAMAKYWGDRDAAVTRELTKRFEDIRRGTLSALAAYYAANGAPKGEIVIVVAAATAPPAQDWQASLVKALRTATVRDAAEAVAKATGASKRQIYARALELAAADKE